MTVPVIALLLASALTAFKASAQNLNERDFRPDVRRALSSRTKDDSPERRASATAARSSDRETFAARAENRSSPAVGSPRRPARPASRKAAGANQKTTTPTFPNDSTNTSQTDNASSSITAPITTRIRPGTPLSRILHTSQLGIDSLNGINQLFTDRNMDLIADERTVFDSDGGSFDFAVGRSGARYEVFTAIDRRGTIDPRDDIPYGVIVVALDTNGDYVRDSESVYDLERDFGLPSAVTVVSGTARSGREFVIVSSSGYYNRADAGDPNNEPSAGVVLLVSDPLTGGFDNSRSRELVRVGNNQLSNANGLALLPNNDLLIADFDSNELRIVRDTNADGVPDTLDPIPYYRYQLFSGVPLDAPLDVAANSRGVVFTHSYGNDAALLAIYDDNGDGRGDVDEVAVEGLSLDNNLIFHGLTVDREGTVYVIQDASGTADTPADGGNRGTPRIDAFPDPALNGILRDGEIYVEADKPLTDALSGLAFGVDTTYGAINRLSMVNSASLRGAATRDGLATVIGSGLTRGAQGSKEADAETFGIRVLVEGRRARVLSFNDTQINLYLPPDVSIGANAIVVSVNGVVVAADDATVASANPGVFTTAQTGAGEAVTLLTSGWLYMPGPFPAKSGGQSSVVALFGTGWRGSLPVTATVGGRPATIEYAGQSGGFGGLDQINLVIPDGVKGAATVVVTTASGVTSHGDVVITIK